MKFIDNIGYIYYYYMIVIVVTIVDEMKYKLLFLLNIVLSDIWWSVTRPHITIIVNVSLCPESMIDRQEWKIKLFWNSQGIVRLKVSVSCDHSSKFHCLRVQWKCNEMCLLLDEWICDKSFCFFFTLFLVLHLNLSDTLFIKSVTNIIKLI